mmetsp:Transcript_17276/g.43399  ORF Transcript_17276/g.43399 Transcript_17276/m.43399 type:complete len:358 (+) Transcript_17276:290-1363(+)
MPRQPFRRVLAFHLQRGDRGGQLCEARPILRLLRPRPLNQPPHRRRPRLGQRRPQASPVHRLRHLVHGEVLQLGVRPLAREQFVREDAEGEDVHLVGEVLAFVQHVQLGRHVPRGARHPRRFFLRWLQEVRHRGVLGAQGDAGEAPHQLGTTIRLDRAVVRWRLRVGRVEAPLHAEQAEVGHLGDAVLEQHVLRLQVAVDAAGGVQVLHAKRHAVQPPHRLRRAVPRAAQLAEERAVGAVLHQQLGRRRRRALHRLRLAEAAEAADDVLVAEGAEEDRLGEELRALVRADADDARLAVRRGRGEDLLVFHHFDGVLDLVPSAAVALVQLDEGEAALAEPPDVREFVLGEERALLEHV